MPQISIKNLTVAYADEKKDFVALDGLDATFLSNKFNVVVGYSGSGKTTLLRTLLGQLNYEGTVEFDGEDVCNVPIQRRNMSYVSQQYVLYSNKTIFDNIAFPLTIQRMSRNDIIVRVRDIADKLELTACLTRKPKHLSGGQQQRVALAKALVKQPSVCLLDEPFSNVDPSQRLRSRILTKQALSACNCTSIYVTHDLTEAMALADNLVVIDQGKVVVSGAPLDVFNSGAAVVESLKSATYVDTDNV